MQEEGNQKQKWLR